MKNVYKIPPLLRSASLRGAHESRLSDPLLGISAVNEDVQIWMDDASCKLFDRHPMYVSKIPPTAPCQTVVFPLLSHAFLRDATSESYSQVQCTGTLSIRSSSVLHRPVELMVVALRL